MVIDYKSASLLWDVVKTLPLLQDSSLSVIVVIDNTWAWNTREYTLQIFAQMFLNKDDISKVFVLSLLVSWSGQVPVVDDGLIVFEHPPVYKC